MNKEPVLVIMAAGMGSRYGGLKQMDPVGSGGEAIIDFSIYDAMMAGFEKVIFIIKHEIEEDFKKLIEGRSDRFMQVEYAFQELDDIPAGYRVPEGRVKPWGTCHAVLAARHLVDGPFCVINADDYYGPGAFQSMYDYLKTAEENHYCMVAYELEKTLTENGSVARGVCEEDGNGYLARIDERTKIMWHDGGIAYTEDDGKTFVSVPEGTPVSMNFWGFTKGFMKELEAGLPAFLDDALKNNPLKGEYLLPFTVERLLKEEKISVRMLRSSDRWIGVTYKEDRQGVVDALQAMKDKGLYPEKLWK
ncbi:MAG: nucleotidyltransferase [Firmicutes bacterium]|nr:nucleotidyltransferase [Bacillota bacterium]